jgi:hypothetical protein
VIDWGAFTWVVMPFEIKNGPTYLRIVNRAFEEYLNQFLKIVLDDITFYNNNGIFKKQNDENSTLVICVDIILI